MSEGSSSRKRGSDFIDQATVVKRSKNDLLSDETQIVLEILKLEDKRTNFIKVRRRLNDHFAKENRVQLVIEEFLADQNKAQIKTNTNEDDELLDELIFSNAAQPETNANKDGELLDESFFHDLGLLVNVLKTINPDSPVDENLVYEALLKCPNREQRVELTLQELLNKNEIKTASNSGWFVFRQPIKCWVFVHLTCNFLSPFLFDKLSILRSIPNPFITLISSSSVIRALL